MDTMSAQNSEHPHVPAQPQVGVWDVLRFVIELFAFVSLAVWGFIAWPLPWNIVVGIGAPLFAIVLWALFRSPKAVIRITAVVGCRARVVRRTSMPSLPPIFRSLSTTSK